MNIIIFKNMKKNKKIKKYKKNNIVVEKSIVKFIFLKIINLICKRKCKKFQIKVYSYI